MTYECLYHGHGWGVSSQEQFFWHFIIYKAKLMLISWDKGRCFLIMRVEGMITWYWLADHACTKLVSHFKLLQMDFEKEFQKGLLLSLI